MLIIWRGFGWLVPLIAFAGFLVMQLSLDALYGEEYYSNNEWPKLAAVLASSFIIALLGYYLNFRKRITVTDESTGKSKKSPAHALFFIPIQFWAIILPALFFYFESHIAEVEAKETVLIQSPKVHDLYSTDFSKVFEGANPEYKYGVLRVASLSPNGVTVQISELTYNLKTGVNKDVREGKTSEVSYYLSNEYDTQFSISELSELHSKGVIFAVDR